MLRQHLVGKWGNKSEARRRRVRSREEGVILLPFLSLSSRSLLP